MVQIASTSALSVAANAKSSDIVTGTYQFTPFDGDLTVYARASATGLNVSITVDGVNVIGDQSISFTGTAGAISKIDHEVATIEVGAGSRVEVTFRNTTGGAITVDSVVEVV